MRCLQITTLSRSYTTYVPHFLKKYLGKLIFLHFKMGKLFEGFQILCSEFNHILEKKGGGTIQGGILFKGGTK